MTDGARGDVLTTARLTLRPIERADVPSVSRLWTDPEVRRHLGGPVAEDVVRERERRCVGAPGVLCVVRTRDSAVVGLVTVEPAARQGRTEVSYQLLPEHWGFGYAREAVGAVVARTVNGAGSDSTAPHDVVAVTQEANSRSRRLLEALGAEPVERFVEWGEPQVLYAFAAPPAEAPKTAAPGTAAGGPVLRSPGRQGG
ncbi:GNAT family N-acetyltransferase [Streptomyces sp. NPDC018029]|uniref:GNAT family N-acetyltransferase n=1 Tax=Streptomyces sp. NPDC018029 TaxID=3365032 RepID=UPI0037B3EBA1